MNDTNLTPDPLLVWTRKRLLREESKKNAVLSHGERMIPCQHCPHPGLETMNAALFGAYAVTLVQHYIDPLTPTAYGGLAVPPLRYGLAIVLVLVGGLQALACWCDTHSSRAPEQYSWCRRRALCAWFGWVFWWAVMWSYFSHGINVLSGSGSLVFGIGQIYQYLRLNSYIREHRRRYGRGVLSHVGSASAT